MSDIALVNNIPEHYGSVHPSGSISSSVNATSPSFVTVEGIEVMSIEDTIDTPTHNYTPVASHSHSGQVVDNTQQSFVTIDGNIVVTIGDSNTTNDTRVETTTQSFVLVS